MVARTAPITQRFIAAITGLVIGAALWAAIALPAALAYDMFYDVNERCYQQSLNDVLHDAGEGSATGCVPAVAFVILGAARYGPAVLLVPSADINRQAPFLSGLFFAALSALAFALAGRRAGLLITVAVVLFLEFVLAGFLLVLWASA